MKIAVIAIDFPLGKQALSDERLEKLKSIFHVSKVTEIQIEFLNEAQVKDADGIISDAKAKLDLILQDLEIVENRLSAEPAGKEIFLHCKEALEKEIVLNEVPFSDYEKQSLLGINLITLKPIIFVDKENLAPIPQIMRQAYADYGMISFFTVNERELRAWPIKKGNTVFEAAGTIHSDIQRGFIKAEVVGYEDLIKSGGINQARSKGLLKLEDKGYVVKDGDLIQIKFNV